MKTAAGSPRRAARVSISYVGFLTAPSAWSTSTRISLMSSQLPASDELLGGEEVGERLRARALLVLDDLACFARRPGGGLRHLGPRHGEAHVAGIDPEVGQRQRLEGLLLGRHDPLERRVPR